ncbi:hypothetical protein AKJ18_34820, partial [Vibrio xuii]
RHRGLLHTLDAIEELELLEAGGAGHLRDAYKFLRRLENLLQAMADKQTQTLPDSDTEQLQLAIAMGYSSWDELMGDVRHHMAAVHQVFTNLIGDEEEESSDVASHFH